MKLVALRHLATDFNLRKIMQGRRDIPTLPIEQAELEKIEANLLKIRAEQDRGYDHVLTSSLVRTRMTAEAYGHRADVEPLLDELDFGPYEGRPISELIREQPLWIESPDQLVLGEPLSDLEKRVRAFCAKYENCDRTLIFGHGAWIRALVSMVRTGSIRSMNQMVVHNNDVVVLEVPAGGV